MASVEQITALIDFMEQHPNLALNRFAKNKEGRSQTIRLWVECASILNSISSDCGTKEAKQWRQYFNEYKSKLSRKIKMEKAEIGATGGGPRKPMMLTQNEDRLWAILGRDLGEPLPGVRHNPISQETTTSIDSHQENNNNHQHIIIEEVNYFDHDQLNIDPELSTRQQDQIAVSEDDIILGSAPDTSQELRQHTAPPASSAPKPKRKRRRRQETVNSNSRNEDEEPHMNQASAHLEAMEKLSADATREHADATRVQAAAIVEHAQATNRVAAALEEIATCLRDPIIIQVQMGTNSSSSSRRVRSLRVIYSSSEDE